MCYRSEVHIVSPHTTRTPHPHARSNYMTSAVILGRLLSHILQPTSYTAPISNSLSLKDIIVPLELSVLRRPACQPPSTSRSTAQRVLPFCAWQGWASAPLSFCERVDDIHSQAAVRYTPVFLPGGLHPQYQPNRSRSGRTARAYYKKKRGQLVSQRKFVKKES